MYSDKNFRFPQNTISIISPPAQNLGKAFFGSNDTTFMNRRNSRDISIGLLKANLPINNPFIKKEVEKLMEKKYEKQVKDETRKAEKRYKSQIRNKKQSIDIRPGKEFAFTSLLSPRPRKQASFEKLQSYR